MTHRSVTAMSEKLAFCRKCSKSFAMRCFLTVSVWRVHLTKYRQPWFQDFRYIYLSKMSAFNTNLTSFWRLCQGFPDTLSKRDWFCNLESCLCFVCLCWRFACSDLSCDCRRMVKHQSWSRHWKTTTLRWNLADSPWKGQFGSCHHVRHSIEIEYIDCCHQ